MEVCSGLAHARTLAPLEVQAENWIGKRFKLKQGSQRDPQRARTRMMLPAWVLRGQNFKGHCRGRHILFDDCPRLGNACYLGVDSEMFLSIVAYAEQTFCL